MPKLENLNVVIFESRHAQTIADMVKLNGGTPVSAPSMREVPLEDNVHVFSFAEKLFRSEIDVIILLTGVGTRALMNVLETRYQREDILTALKETTLVPRGPKPIRVLKEWGVPFAVTVPEPNTWREILGTLDQNKETIPIKDKVVAVQEYGVTNEFLLQGLKERGAKLLVVPVYRWALPEDVGPLKKAIREMIEGRAEVALFTTAVQIHHVLKMAGEMGVAEDLKKAFQKMVVASVGPDCTEAIESYGLSVDIQPESPKMGPLVREVADKAHTILTEKSHTPGV